MKHSFVVTLGVPFVAGRLLADGASLVLFDLNLVTSVYMASKSFTQLSLSDSLSLACGGFPLFPHFPWEME